MFRPKSGQRSRLPPARTITGELSVVASAVTVASSPEACIQRQERDDPAAAATKAEGPALSYRHAFMDLSVPKRAATPPGSSATPQRPLPVPAMVHHVPGSPPAFSATDTAPAAIPGEYEDSC